MDWMKYVVTTDNHFNKVADIIKAHKNIVFDLETTDLFYRKAKICGIGVGVLDDEGKELLGKWYIPLMEHNGLPIYLDTEKVIDTLRELFLDENRFLIAHNLKFDMQILINYGIDLRPKLGLPPWNVPNVSKEEFRKIIDSLPREASCACTQVMAWLVNENRRAFGLKEIAKEEFGLDMTKLDKILKPNRKTKLKFHEAPAEQTMPYALMDVEATYQLYKKYSEQLKKEGLWDVFLIVEMPFVGVLQGMERRGMPVNKHILELIKERCENELFRLRKEIHALSQTEFNVQSPQQLAHILYDRLGLPVIAKTKNGAVKVDSDTLEKLLKLGEQYKDVLKDRHIRGLKLIEKVLEYRALAKTLSTYIEGFIDKITEDGRVFANFKQHGTVTGRLSSSDPNLQNLPTGPIFVDKMSVEEYNKLYEECKEEAGGDELKAKILLQKKHPFTLVPVYKVDENGNETEEVDYYEVRWQIRDAFQEWKRDWWLIVGDYGQMELRMTAHLTGDEAMIEGFKSGIDIHKYNASVVNRVPIEQVTKEMRRDAKAVSFGLIYGKTIYGFAQDWFGEEPDFWKKRPKDQNDFGEINDKYLKQTEDIVNRFFEGFPKVLEGIKKTHKYIEKYGYVKTITGRKRRIPEIFSTNKSEQNRARRQAFNARVQGSSADFIKMAMIKLERELYMFQDPGSEYEIGQVLQVHDELMLVAPPDRIVEMKEVTKNIMENVVQLRCPIEADLEIGWKYGSCK